MVSWYAKGCQISVDSMLAYHISFFMYQILIAPVLHKIYGDEPTPLMPPL